MTNVTTLGRSVPPTSGSGVFEISVTPGPEGGSSKSTLKKTAEAVENIASEALASPGVKNLTRAVKMLGKGLEFADAATGVVSAIKTFRDEERRGDTVHQGTMEGILTSVAQSSITVGVGGFVTTALAGAAGVTALPIIAGIGAGIAAGYGVGKFIDWVREG